MAFKVNYGLKKAERDRAKKAKKEAKARDRDASAPASAVVDPSERDAAPLAEGGVSAPPVAEQ